MTRILIADRDDPARHALKELLAKEIAGVEFGDAVESAEMIRLLAEAAWDLLILNIDMPAQRGFETLVDVRRRFPSLPVLVLASMPENQLELSAITKGANGFLNKQTEAKQLFEAVRKILTGEPFISRSLAQTLVNDLRSAVNQPRHQSLSRRELQVITFIARGRSLKEIAAELSLSAKTISTFHMRILKKLGLKNDVALVRYVQEHGLM